MSSACGVDLDFDGDIIVCFSVVAERAENLKVRFSVLSTVDHSNDMVTLPRLTDHDFAQTAFVSTVSDAALEHAKPYPRRNRRVWGLPNPFWYGARHHFFILSIAASTTALTLAVSSPIIPQ